MTLWIILTFLTTGTALLLAFPLIRRFEPPQSAEAQIIAMGKEQLAALDLEAARGQIDEDDAALAKSEIERRIVAAAKAPETTFTTPSSKGRGAMVFAVGGWLVAGATGIYFLFGRPDLPTQPFVQANAPVAVAEPQRGAAVAEAPPGNVGELITNLEARIADNPDDAEGLRMLAWSYFTTERYALAADTYGKSVALDASDPDVLSAYAESRVRAADGMVDERSVELSKQALALNPQDARAGFFIGMAAQQAGEPAEALAIWQAILNNAPAGADWAPGLAQRVEELRAELGSNAPSIPLMSGGGVNLPEISTAPGPTQADVAAAADMTEQDRGAMISGMVDRLAGKLAENPNDPEGWQRLIRAYMVMGNEDKAREALLTASLALADQPEAVSGLVSFATDLGLRM
jgi:cytochrome c-type biogenesis protein CcmH